MVEFNDIAAYLLLLSVVIGAFHEELKLLLTPKRVSNFIPKRLIRNDLIQISKIILISYRLTGFFFTLFFGVSLLFAKPNTGASWLNSATALFVATWTTFTVSIAINSSYKRLQAWGAEIQTRVLYGEEPIPASPWYVGTVAFIIAFLLTIGIYGHIADILSLPSLYDLSIENQIAVLLFGLVISFFYGVYKFGEHMLNS